MLPALTPTQTLSVSDGSRSASPDSRIQWHRYVASPPSTSRTSASRTQGTHRSAPIVGRAVSSRTPSEAQPRPEKCFQLGSAATRPRTDFGPHMGCPHWAVGTTSAWHSAIGLPSSCTSDDSMLAFVTPPDVSKSFNVPPGSRRTGRMPVTTWRVAQSHRDSLKSFALLGGYQLRVAVSCRVPPAPPARHRC